MTPDQMPARGGVRSKKGTCYNFTSDKELYEEFQDICGRLSCASSIAQNDMVIDHDNLLEWVTLTKQNVEEFNLICNKVYKQIKNSPKIDCDYLPF